MTWTSKVVSALALALLAGCGVARFDTVIGGGRVVDGTGNAWFYGDVGVRAGRIAAVSRLGGLALSRADRRIDATGMVVAPGFIDIQGQSQEQLLTGDSRLVSKITQGVTTEILGEGWSMAPGNQKTLQAVSHDGDRRQARRFIGPHGFARWLAAMEQHRASVNFGSFIGGATVRMLAKGMAQGDATPAELAVMKAAVREAMQDGAFGIASALIYPPGEYASAEELIEISRAMAPSRGVYITHLRSEGDRLLEAIDEAIRIGREAGVPVEIFHLKAAGVRNWPKMADAIARIESARASGLDISANMYAYTAGESGLAACLPPWSASDGKLFDNVSREAARRRIREAITAPDRAWENLCELATPAGVLITELTSPWLHAWSGKRLDEIAAGRRKDWIDTAMDLIDSEHTRVETIFFMASEENLRLQLKQPWMKFGTDADGVDPASSKGLTHPRTYGNYTRVLGKYVREEKVLPLEEAVRKMTSAVANRLSLRDRGVVREGAWADLVVFDPQTVADRATFEEPHQLSVGIRDVLVNGVAVVSDGKVTGAKPGKALYGPGKK